MSPQMHQRDCTMRREQWRNRYESSWTEAAECETRLRFDLERLTGQVVEFCDAGAGEKDRTVGTGVPGLPSLRGSHRPESSCEGFRTALDSPGQGTPCAKDPADPMDPGGARDARRVATGDFVG